MGISSDMLNAPRDFLKLFKEGKEAAKRGDNAKAHDLFRQAIVIDPYHEQIWLWLASVVETDEDRRVCFENVLELNPTHPTARRQIHLLDEKRLQESTTETGPHKRRLSRRRRAMRLLLIIAIGAAAGAAIVAWGIV